MITPLRTVDHLVIGGGPAGAMAAIRLAEAGRQVTLAEKESGPRGTVCGEFLSREAVDYLKSVAIAPSDLGAKPIDSVRLYAGKKCAEAALPFPALSLSRRLLDAVLLARAAEAGCEVLRGRCVQQLTARDGGWVAEFESGDGIAARTVFLASGKHDVRGWGRGRGKQNGLVGFKMHWRLGAAQVAALRESIELFLFAGGYAGLSLVEDDTANLCMAVRGSSLRAAGGWKGLLAGMLASNLQLRERLSGAEALASLPFAIAPIPYGYLAERAHGLWRIGDQAAVIPSFTGDGIAIALHSATLAVRMLLDGKSAEEYLSTLRGQVRRPMRLGTWISRAMVAAPGRYAAPIFPALLPAVLRAIASATRVPERALVTMHSDPVAAAAPWLRQAP